MSLRHPRTLARLAPRAAGARRRGGFALPIVVLLAMVATIASLVMLERHANAHLAVERRIDGYHEHHARLGIKEMIDQWLLTTGGNVGERLLDGGLAFELLLPNGRGVRVWMEDGQGSLLRRPTGSGSAFEAARMAAQAIAQSLGEPIDNDPRRPAHVDRPSRDDKNDLPEYERPKLRDAGPLAVSALTADFDVLVTIVAAAGGGEASTMVAGDIITEREDGQLSPTDLTRICDQASVQPRARAVIAQLLTTSPTLWRVVAESDEGRWTGLLEQAPRGAGLAGGGTTSLLEWERIPVDVGP